MKQINNSISTTLEVKRIFSPIFLTYSEELLTNKVRNSSHALCLQRYILPKYKINVLEKLYLQLSMIRRKGEKETRLLIV